MKDETAGPGRILRWSALAVSIAVGATIPADTNASAAFIGRTPGVLAGLEIARMVCEAVDPNSRPVKADASSRVLGLIPAGADPHDESTLTDEVEAGQLLGEDGGVTQIVVEHEGAEPYAFGGHRDRRERRYRGKLRREVVMNAQVAVADRLSRARTLKKRRPIDDPARRDHELEWLHAEELSPDPPKVGAAEAARRTNQVPI